MLPNFPKTKYTSYYRKFEIDPEGPEWQEFFDGDELPAGLKYLTFGGGPFKGRKFVINPDYRYNKANVQRGKLFN